MGNTLSMLNESEYNIFRRCTQELDHEDRLKK